MCSKQRLISVALGTLFAMAIAASAAAQYSAAEIMSKSPAELIEILNNPKVSVFAKAKVCQRLALIGTEDAVPALAALLPDEELGAYARSALESIPHPTADEALREAATRRGTLKRLQLIGIINSIGRRKDTQATGVLKALLGDSDASVAQAAGAALGRIGTTEAAGILKAALVTSSPVKASVANACLACADQLVMGGERVEAIALYESVAAADIPKHRKAAAIYGQLRLQKAEAKDLLLAQIRSPDAIFFNIGLAAVRQMPGADVTAALVREIDRLPPERQAGLLRALGDRKEPVPLAGVIAASKSPSAVVRAAAIYVLGKHGGDSALPILVDASLGTGEVAREAKFVLGNTVGKNVDVAICAKLTDADPKAKVSLFELVGSRGIAEALPEVLKATEDPNEELRLAAIRTLGRIVSLEELPMLVERLVVAKTLRETAATHESLKAACARMPDRDACAGKLLDSMDAAPAVSKGFLLQLLSSVGGARALTGVCAYARNADEDIQDAATRALGEWMSVDAAPQLLELAHTIRNDKFKTRVLRGYIRIVRQLGIPADQKVTMCQEALGAACRDDERRMVLQVLGRLPSVKSLSLAASCLTVPALRDEAITAVLEIGEKLSANEARAVADAMRQVLKAGASGEKADRAKAILEQTASKVQ
jgi:HEAT repeat protein